MVGLILVMCGSLLVVVLGCLSVCYSPICLVLFVVDLCLVFPDLFVVFLLLICCLGFDYLGLVLLLCSGVCFRCSVDFWFLGGLVALVLLVCCLLIVCCFDLLLFVASLICLLVTGCLLVLVCDSLFCLLVLF